MLIELPAHINPNDLIAALSAGAEAIGKGGQPSDPMTAYNAKTLRDFRDVVVQAARK